MKIHNYSGMEPCSVHGMIASMCEGFYWYNTPDHSTHLVAMDRIRLQRVANRILVWNNDELFCAIDGATIWSVRDMMEARSMVVVEMNINHDIPTMYDDWNPDPKVVHQGRVEMVEYGYKVVSQ